MFLEFLELQNPCYCFIVQETCDPTLRIPKACRNKLDSSLELLILRPLKVLTKGSSWTYIGYLQAFPEGNEQFENWNSLQKQHLVVGKLKMHRMAGINKMWPLFQV